MTRSRRCRDFRKHVAWYLKGFPVGGETRAALGMVSSLAELDVPARAPRRRRAVPVRGRRAAARAYLRPATGGASRRLAGRSRRRRRPRGRRARPTRVAEIAAGTLAGDDDDRAGRRRGADRARRVRRLAVRRRPRPDRCHLGVIWLVSVPVRVWWIARQDQRPHVRRAARARREPVQREAVAGPAGAARARPRRSTRTASRRDRHGRRQARRATSSPRPPPARTGWWRTAYRPPTSWPSAPARDTWNSLAGGRRRRWDRNGWDSAVIVTDPWHSFRSREMARHLGHRRGDLADPQRADRPAAAHRAALRRSARPAPTSPGSGTASRQRIGPH